MTKEHLRYSDYEIMASKPSKIDPSGKVTAAVGFNCPRCRHLNAALEHGSSTVCPKCGLRMELWGNGLDCAADEETSWRVS